MMEKSERLQNATTTEKVLPAEDVIVLDEDEYLRLVDRKEEEYDQSEDAPHLDAESYVNSENASEGGTMYERVETLEQGSVRTGSGTARPYRDADHMLSRTILPPDTKVVMYVKGEKPGDKPRLVKLRPVAHPTKPDLRFAYETLRKATQKTSLSLPPRARKRRIIQSTTKRSNRQTISSTKITDHSGTERRPAALKTEPDAKTVHGAAGTNASNRPKRAHKKPQRYGDYIEERNNAINPLTSPSRTVFQLPVSKHEEGIITEQDETFTGKDEYLMNSGSGENGSNELEEVEIESENDIDVEGDEDEEEDFGEIGDEADKNKADRDGNDKAERLQCDRCQRYFANHNSMNAHRFKVHRVVIRASVKCPGCDHRATTIHTLNEHVADEHNLKLQFVKKRFKDTADFQKYLDDLAVTKNMGFVLHRKSENKRQLYCNRSGAIRINKGDALRNRPRKGTAKIGAMCPAYIFYTENGDGSIEVNGQLAHFGHAMDPRFVFPATSSEKVVSRLHTPTRERGSVGSLQRPIPLDLHDRSKKSGSSYTNVTAYEQSGGEAVRREAEEALEQQFGPVHPNSEEIDIRMKNIDRLCSFLFDNVSEQLYRLNDETMDMVLRAMRTTQNSISNLNSMMIQIKENDPNVVQKFQRRGPRYNQWMSFSSFGNKQRKQYYDTEEYDEDTVYYRHVPLRSSDDFENVYVVTDGQMQEGGEGERTRGEQYYQEEVSQYHE